jgi:hypothetical protein
LVRRTCLAEAEALAAEICELVRARLGDHFVAELEGFLPRPAAA